MTCVTHQTKCLLLMMVVVVVVCGGVSVHIVKSRIHRSIHM